ncbi:MAG TPA: Hsp70 family protein [Ktedonobacterales bacterium]
MASGGSVYGIDLGTTYSCIALVNDAGRAEVVPNVNGDLTTPSVVLFENSTSRVVGKEAKNSAKLYPTQVVEMVKRHMGDPNWTFTYEGVDYRPEEISSYILRKVVDDAQAQTGNTINDVVITCPAYFGINEREATARAGKIAGLNVLEIINEPTAAAISFGTQNEQNQVVLVYDLGGGTFDITMIEIKENAITVIATGGDKELGGRDWDAAVVTYLAQEWMRETGSSDDPTTSPDSLQDLWIRAEDAKRALSAKESTRVAVSHAGQTAAVTLTREKFDELTAGLLEQTILFTKQMLEAARQKGYTAFDKLLLVGGSTKMPQVPERLKREFNRDPQLNEPDLSVAKGAALYGQKLVIGEKIKTAVASMTGQNADDVDLSAVASSVVQRAEQQVANSEGLLLADVQRSQRQTITNVVSHSFGVVVVESSSGRDVISNLVKKQDSLPVEITKRYGTFVANMTTVEIRVMENEVVGEQVDDVANGREIGNALIEGLPPGLPAGSPIDVTFTLDQQGRLHVEGVEPGSGRRAEATIQTAEGMSEAEVAAAARRTSGLTIAG